jgi:hypothetical protein
MTVMAVRLVTVIQVVPLIIPVMSSQASAGTYFIHTDVKSYFVLV